MIKSNAIVKVDSEVNWNKAVNYIPDTFTIIVYTYDTDAPKVKIGDGIHKVGDLPFLNNREVVDDVLVL